MEGPSHRLEHFLPLIVILQLRLGEFYLYNKSDQTVC